MRLQRDEGEHCRVLSALKARDYKTRSIRKAIGRQSAVAPQRKSGTRSGSERDGDRHRSKCGMLRTSVEGQMIKYLAFVSLSILPPLIRFSADFLN